MASLLHIDSSINGDNSHSRKVTATFAEEWRKANPAGQYVYRDVAADPLPHFGAADSGANHTPRNDHTPEQAKAWAFNQTIVNEVLAADVILVGAPMYNFTIPTHLKSWLDRLAIQRFFTDPETGRSELSDKKFVVATARGGSYAPGTPRESFDHQEPYIRSFLNFIGADKDLTFLHTEMAFSLFMPHLAEFKHIYEQTSRSAHENARKIAVG